MGSIQKLKAIVLLLAKSLLAFFGKSDGLRLKLATTLLDKSHNDNVKQDRCQQNQHIQPRFIK
ncbi:MAG: hypothetical protein KC433_13700 [Anaerolineales bacterium]|nr:hypothetical protein [Anaerolineales bacterium]